MRSKNKARYTPTWQRLHRIDAKPRLLLALVLLASGLLAVRRLARPVEAKSHVETAWHNVRRSDSYDFSADVRMTYFPLATTGNIGRFSREQGLYLEGSNNLRDESLQLAMWGGAVSAANADAAYRLRIRDGVAETQQADGDWQKSDAIDIGFAPGGDFLAFLDVADEVVYLGRQQLQGEVVDKYGFTIDAPAYAERLRMLTQQRMQQAGELPHGVALRTPEHLATLDGQGELWLDARGLPLRQKVTLAIPAAEGSDYRTEADLTVNFSAFDGSGVAFDWRQPVQFAAFALRGVELPAFAQAGGTLLLYAATMLICATLLQPRQQMMRVVNTGLLVAIVALPLLQAKTAHAAQTKQVSLMAAQEERRRTTRSPLDHARSFAVPQPRVPLASLNLQQGTIDSDGDGLSDEVEAAIGTSRYSTDSDGDSLSDYVEVNGFFYNGQTWYSNPLWPDTNRDGTLDVLEWNTGDPDLDGDGTPDLHDFDDDGDGISDDIDLSRLVASIDDEGNPVIFDADNPLELRINALEQSRYTYVTLQLRPINADHLWYAYNVLDWPEDHKGNMQDWDQKTFFDVCVANGGNNCSMTPDANGDVKLVPMIEVQLNDLSSLPHTAGGDLDEALLRNYDISIQPAGDGGYFLYAPLHLIEDSVTGAKVAFNTWLIFQPHADWQPHQLRLVWALQVLNEQYGSPDEAQELLEESDGFGENRHTILHAYYDQFQLTGLNVQEERGVELAIVYEDPETDPDVAEDDMLLHMVDGLGKSYLINRDCDFVDNEGRCIGDGERDITIDVIKQRWDRFSNSGSTDGQRWGIARDRLAVETYSFDHSDEATMVGGRQHAAEILNSRFGPASASDASLLFVRETRMRANNLDSRAVGGDGFGWDGRTIEISFERIDETISGDVVLAPYRFDDQGGGWMRQTPEEVVEEIEQRYPISAEELPPEEQETTSGDQVAAVLVYSSAVEGSQTILSQQGSSGLTTSALGFSSLHWQGVNVTDEDLRRVLQQAAVSSGRLFLSLSKKQVLASMDLTDTRWQSLVDGQITMYEEFLDDLAERNLIPPKEKKVVSEVVPKKVLDPEEAMRQIDRLNQDQEFDEVAARTKRQNFVAGRYFVSAMMITFMVGAFIATNFEGGQTAGQLMLSAMAAVNDTVDAIVQFREVSKFVKTLPGETLETLPKIKAYLMARSNSLSSVAAKAGAIGLVIGLVTTWAMFFAAWGRGGLSTDSIEFNNLLAGAIAATLVIVVSFIISLSVIGAIVLAVFAIFDLLVLIICKAGVEIACDLGITEAFIKIVTQWLYTGQVMIDTAADPALTNIRDVQMRLKHPELGPVAGNMARFVVDVDSHIRHEAPEAGVIYHYSNFFTAEDLTSATVSYSLDAQERRLSVPANQSEWYQVHHYGIVFSLVPAPVLGWLAPTRKSKDLFAAQRSDQLLSPPYELDTAQINRRFELYLNSGMNLPRYDCWFQICVHKSVSTAVSTDLGEQFILDVLPATLTEFVAWSELGEQVDSDGDGLPHRVDPDPTSWDADGDGVPDGVERERGMNALSTDSDGDGLSDAAELRYMTSALNADSDGDGLDDLTEIEGYGLTFDGVPIHVTSNPVSRDGDLDGMSDGVERRLNLLDPESYPFHPGIFNRPPLRIYAQHDDFDGVLPIGGQATFTATVFNGTDEHHHLTTVGDFTATLPVELGGATATRPFTLLPTLYDQIVLTGTAEAGERFVAVGIDAAADVAAIGEPAPTAPFIDIILDDKMPVTIDDDDPDEPTLTLGEYVQPDSYVVIGGTASDPTSYVRLVEVSVAGGSFITATGTSLWAFGLSIPDQADGAVDIDVRVTDAVGHTTTKAFALTIDGTSPIAALDLAPNDVRTVRRNADGDWTLALSGNNSDALAGIRDATVQIGQSAVVAIPEPDGDWEFNYPFDDIATNSDPAPTGPYTLTLTVRDNALPDGNAVTQIVPFVLDMTPPVVELQSHEDERQLLDGTVVTGTVRDQYAHVEAVEYAFVDAETVLAVEETLLQLPLNDLPETLLFDNHAMQQTRIYCLDESCPTSGVAGADGTAVQFDGVDDLLRAFDRLDLPPSGVTTSFWFNTTCADCGLLSVVSGNFPAIDGHDRALYLAAGKLCVDVQAPSGVETRCSIGDDYADGQWHQAVHVLGAGGNRLLIDGQLVVASPTSASTFGDQNRLLIGHATPAANPYFAGSLDDIIIYANALSDVQVAALYRPWHSATLTGDSWSFTVPPGLEGVYQIDMRAIDSVGNRTESRGDWPQFRGPIDSSLPTFDVTVGYQGSGSSAQTHYQAQVGDYNLTDDGYEFVCPLSGDQLRHTTSPGELAFSGQARSRLTEIVARCRRDGFQSSLVAVSACDRFGHCAAATPSQIVAYIGTSHNRLLPYGSLPNAIERVNLSDPVNRVRLIERPGQQITDIAVDQLNEMIYWGEREAGGYARPAAIWRANLDGSNPQLLVDGLIAYGPEMLQIAVDPVGNKLYWTRGHELWWANLDGTLAAVVYSIPPDTNYVNGNLDSMQIGDVAVDPQNDRLYLSERRQRGALQEFNSGIRYSGQTFAHTLIVSATLNGSAPAFVAGAGPDCHYDRFYESLGAGVDPSQCLTSPGFGIDVEALAVSDGAVYWSAIDGDRVNAGVYGRRPNEEIFSVAPLSFDYNYEGLKAGPLPQLAVVEPTGGVYVQHGRSIVRGEPGGEFTMFTDFVDYTPGAAGTVRRSSSTLTAMAIVRTEQTVQTDVDLAIAIVSPELVMLDGDTSRYDITVRNDAALPADDTQLVLTLGEGASFAGADRPCDDGGTTVTCDFGRFAALSQQTVSISFTVATATVHDLTATVTVSSATEERTPHNNTATHANITAAPTLSALPGLPYIYYGQATRLTRVALFGDYLVEPVEVEGSSAGRVVAGDLARDRLYVVTDLGQLIAVDPDGTNPVTLADVNPNVLATQARLWVAVDEASGRVYYSEITSYYLTTIKSIDPDNAAEGRNAQTVVELISGQKGLVVDSVRGKLYWVALDGQQRQELILRSELDGSQIEVVHAAPAGSQIRYLALDPYAQKLYWLDPTLQDGALLWADSDGGQLSVLLTYLGADASGLVVRPTEDAIYYFSENELVRNRLHASEDDAETLAEIDGALYAGLSNLVPTVFAPTYLNPPAGNLAFTIAQPRAEPPCTLNDSHEPNDTVEEATWIDVATGSATVSGALCRTELGLSQDIDIYTATVAGGARMTATLRNLPADYGLYAIRDGQTVATSLTDGLLDEQLLIDNYGTSADYAIVVFSGESAINAEPYTLDVAIGDAPPQTSFSDEQCQAVDPLDAPLLAGNGSQANATPLTVGQVVTGALCYDADVDFFAFDAVSGAQLTFDLIERPADYELHIFRPDGSFFAAQTVTDFGTPLQIDAGGTWAVAVRDPDFGQTLSVFQLLVSDSTCSVDDSWEPNNLPTNPAQLGSPGRVHATLCDSSDVDIYSLSAAAGQRLTINMPASDAEAKLRLLDDQGAIIGQLTTGHQGNWQLQDGGDYILEIDNPSLDGSNASYMFQWLLDTAQPVGDRQYIYYTTGVAGQLYRVALSDDYTAEPLYLADTQLASGPAIAVDSIAGRLYSYRPQPGDGAITRNDLVPFDGSGHADVVDSPNPDEVSVPPVAIAVDKSTGRIYWIQPHGAGSSLASTIRSADWDGGDAQQIVGAGVGRNSLAIDTIMQRLYYIENGAIISSRLDGSDIKPLRAAVAGEQPRDLAIDPLLQTLYWIEPTQSALMMQPVEAAVSQTLRDDLSADARGLALDPLQRAIYYTNGTSLMRMGYAGDGLPTSNIELTQLAGSYSGPSNLDPSVYPHLNIQPPSSSLALGVGVPLVSACSLADGHEPNDDPDSATPLHVVTETVTTGALCSPLADGPTDLDHYRVTVADQTYLTVTVSEMPANYRLIVLDDQGINVAFSDNDGLADDTAVVSNVSGAPVTYTLIVRNAGFHNSEPYKLTVAVGSVPPPRPDDITCGQVDRHDAPAPDGNGSLATAGELSLNTPIDAALCYVDDVDMYAFDGVYGQLIGVDLPVRPEDYSLTLYDPNGALFAQLAYPTSVTLNGDGRWTVAVSHTPLVPTSERYQLLITDGNCIGSDAYEPNDTSASARLLSHGARVHATLCGAGDSDIYTFSATAGRQLTLNYPANLTGATLGVRFADGGASLGQAIAGSQAVFEIAADGDYELVVANGDLAERDVPYSFELLLGEPVAEPDGSPYIYYGRVNDMMRVDIISGTVEPIRVPDGFVSGSVLVGDLARGKLYMLDHFERIVQVNPDGTEPVIVIDDTNPNTIRLTRSLAVDERSGDIYWFQQKIGLAGDIMRANPNDMVAGGDAQTVVSDVVEDFGVAIDPVGGSIYWVENSLHNGRVVNHIRRADFDGGEQRTVYAAAPGNEIRELTVDPFARTLYWRDPTVGKLQRIDADGGSLTTIAVVSEARGFVVRPLQRELYYTAGSQLWRAELDGANPVAIAQLSGSYNGVSNLDANIFAPTAISPPGSNLALAYGVPYGQPCLSVDGYEPNNTLATATPIEPGTLSAAICTSDYTMPDSRDSYQIEVADGQQISVTLTDLPGDYGLSLAADGNGVASSYSAGTQDEHVSHVNRSGAPIVYTIMVVAGTEASRLPYTLHVTVGAAPPPPPPPAPPPDACAPFDSYDAPGTAGNQTRATATAIDFNTPITAALCYAGDRDYYSFDGVVGQNVTIALSPRPADYYVYFYRPDGQYRAGIYPDSWLGYGDSITLDQAGRWTVVIWDPYLTPTTDQYRLQLGVNSDCSGLDPYEPNNSQFSPTMITTRTATIRATLCETNDMDWFGVPLEIGDRLYIDVHAQTAETLLLLRPEDGYANGSDGQYDYTASAAGDFVIGLMTYGGSTAENQPYEFEITMVPAPPRPSYPNNWDCTTYTSSDVPQPIDDLQTAASTVAVPISGTVTYVALRDIIFQKGAGLYDTSFGLTAPDGTTRDLFAFEDIDEYNYCGWDNETNSPLDCHLSLDDWAIEGLVPPQFPNTGGTYRPTRSSFSGFNGKSSAGSWTLLVHDNVLPHPGDEDAGDTTGDLLSWGVEICIDNGQPPEPEPEPEPEPSEVPQPGDGAPPGATGGDPVVVLPSESSCTPLVDDYEDDDGYLDATPLDPASSTSVGHTFDSYADVDWIALELRAGLAYTLSVNTDSAMQLVTLALYEDDGTTLIRRQAGRITHAPTRSGRYYVSAINGSGLDHDLCSSGYSVAQSSYNPNRVPVPQPDGGPLPPVHAQPALAAGILTPSDGSVLTETGTISVAVGLTAVDGVQSAELFVNGERVDSMSSRSVQFDQVWSTEWSVASAGVYSLTAVISDSGGLSAAAPANLVFVDLAPPSVTIVVEPVTMATLQSDSSYHLHGTVADDSRIDRVEVSIDGGAWQAAQLDDGGGWRLAVMPPSDLDPGTLTVDVRAIDVAERSASANAALVVDVTPPDPFAIVTELNSGAPISETQFVAERALKLSWPEVAGAVDYYAGYTAAPTPTLASLVPYTGASSRVQVAAEGSIRYAHVIAQDAQGNQTRVTEGPFYIDTAETPDLIADLGFDRWIESGGKQVGQMATKMRGDQKLYVGWDASSLRLRWSGADADAADLVFYLGTGGGGSTGQIDLRANAPAGRLPFSAGYAVVVSSSITATLYRIDGGSWTPVEQLPIAASAASADVLVGFDSLAIDDPAATPLDLLAVASDKQSGAVWATLPDRNIGYDWQQFVTLGSLGAGVVPAEANWADAQMAFELVATPAAGRPLGAGAPFSLTVRATNRGSADLPLLTFEGAASGGVTIDDQPQLAAQIAPSATVSLTLSGQVNGDGQVTLQITDSYHHPVTLGVYSYTLDAVPPHSVTIDLPFAGPLTNTIYVSAQDEVTIASVEVEVDDQTRATTLLDCTSTSIPGLFRCDWQPDAISDGAVYALRARAQDSNGNLSQWSEPHLVSADTTPPALALSSDALAALDDGLLGRAELVLDGTLVDDRQPAGVQLCVTAVYTQDSSSGARCSYTEVISDTSATTGSWQAIVSSPDGNGIPLTVTLTGYDRAGNAGSSHAYSVTIDTEPPVIGPTTLPEEIQTSEQPVWFGSGSASDASDIASVVVLIARPDGSGSVTATVTVDGDSWTATYAPEQPGFYQLLLFVTDGAGNAAVEFAGEIDVLSGSPTSIGARAADAPRIATKLTLIALAVLLLGLISLTSWKGGAVYGRQQ